MSHATSLRHNYSEILTLRTSKGNEKWFEKLRVREIGIVSCESTYVNQQISTDTYVPTNS